MYSAASPPEAVRLYREAFPKSGRSDAAIKTRYHTKIQKSRPEPATGKGFYGDARALHADMMDGMMCDRPLSQEAEAPEPRETRDNPHPWLRMRVRVLDPPDLSNRTGAVVQYNLDPHELLVALDDSHDRVWLPPESLLLIGAGRKT